MATRQEEWIAKSDVGEYVRYYNGSVGVMVFTLDEREAAKTNDSADAWEWCRVAAQSFGRTGCKKMHIRLV